MADDSELIKEKGKSMDAGAVRQKKSNKSYEGKKKELASKVGRSMSEAFTTDLKDKKHFS